MRALSVVLCCSIASLLACTPTTPADVAVEVDPDHPTVVHLDFTSDVPGTSTVTFGLTDDEDAPRHTAPSITGTEHAHLLLGLKAGQRYEWELTFEGEDGSRQEASGRVRAGDPPARLPEFRLDSIDPERSEVYGNYIMLAASNGSGGPNQANSLFFVGILDHEADWVWWHLLPEGFGTVTGTPSYDGRSVYWTEYDERRQDLRGRIVRMTLDGEVLSETFANGAHHATVEPSPGEFAFLGRVFEELSDGSGEQWAMTDTLVSNVEGSKQPGPTFFDYTEDWFEGGVGGYPYPKCRARFEQLYGFDSICELTHSNSLAYVEEEDAFYVLARTPDTLLKLSGDGELLWQMGGPWDEFTLPSGEPVQAEFQANALWSGPHFSQVWPGGLVMFDNGMMRVPPVSSIAEYAWDEQAREVREVWRYAEPDGGFTPHLGDARKLAGGNYVASWMTLDRITEVTPDKEEVLRIVQDRGVSPRRIFVLRDLYDLRKLGVNDL